MTKPTKGIAVHSPFVAEALQRQLGDEWKVFAVGGACGCYQLEFIICPAPSNASAAICLRDTEWITDCLRLRLIPGGMMFYI